MPSAIDLLMPPSYKRPENFSPVAEEAVRKMAERYVGIFDTSTISPVEEKTFSQNFQDNLNTTLGLQNPRQSALKRIADMTQRNVSELEKILRPSKRTPFTVTGGMMAFKMPVNIKDQITIQAAKLALKQAQDKNANIEDVEFYKKYFQKRNVQGQWEDDPTKQHINIFGLRVARGTKLSQLTDHLTLGTTLASIYESLGVDAPTSADHQRFRNDYMKIWGGITGQSLEDGLSGVRFKNAQTILAAYGRTGAGLDSLLFGQIRDPRNPNPAQNKINQGHTVDQTIMFGISAYTNWAGITKKADSEADTSFDAFLQVAQTGGLDAKGVNVNILGEDAIPADMLNKMKLWAKGGTTLKDQFNNSLLPAYKAGTGYDGYLQTLNDEIQRRATAQNIKIDPQTNYNNAVLIIHQLDNGVHGQSTQSGGYNAVASKFPINPSAGASAAPAPTAAPAPNIVTEVSTDKNTNIPVTKRGDAEVDLPEWSATIIDEINQEARKGIASGKDPDGNSVDIENMSKSQQQRYELKWYASAAANRNINLGELYPTDEADTNFIANPALSDEPPTVEEHAARVREYMRSLEKEEATVEEEAATVEEVKPFDSMKWVRDSITEIDRDDYTSFKLNPDDAKVVGGLRDRYTEKWQASGGADGPLADYPPWKFLAFTKKNTDFKGSVNDFYNTFLVNEEEGDDILMGADLRDANLMEQFTIAETALAKFNTEEEINAYNPVGMDARTLRNAKRQRISGLPSDRTIVASATKIVKGLGARLDSKDISGDDTGTKQDDFFDRISSIMGVGGRNATMEEMIEKDLSETQAISLIIEKFVKPNNKLFKIPGKRKGTTQTIFPYGRREQEQAFAALGKRLYDSLKEKETP